ncbi:MAG: high light inducible protein [Cyanothece sp. SIO1E1]|nr:high light inducible protein [Cyanothece sp. SIO1E1]
MKFVTLVYIEIIFEEKRMTSRSYVADERGKLDNFAVEPKMYIQEDAGEGVFTKTAEKLNGRLAMLGFVSLILTEVLTGNSLIDLLTSL